jgi:hypothetical protein
VRDHREEHEASLVGAPVQPNSSCYTLHIANTHCGTSFQTLSTRGVEACVFAILLGVVVVI